MNKIQVTLKRSKFGRKSGHRECVEGLGLRRIGQTVILEKSPSIIGMVKKVSYLLQVEELTI